MRIVYTINCLLFILFTTLTSGAKTAHSSGSTIKVIPPAAFKPALQNTKTPKILLDVRTPAEYANAHLENAVLIDIFRDDFMDAIKRLDHTQPVFIYCAVGGRSAEAAEMLQKAGFKTIYNLDGGITAWQKQKLPVISTVAP